MAGPRPGNVPEPARVRVSERVEPVAPVKGFTPRTDFKTKETVFESDGEEFRVRARSGSDAVRLFKEWLKARNG